MSAGKKKQTTKSIPEGSSLRDSSTPNQDAKLYAEHTHTDTSHVTAQQALKTYPVRDEMLGVSNASVQVCCLYSGPARDGDG